MKNRLNNAAILAIPLLCFLGCAAEDPEVAKYRETLFLDAAPSDSVTIEKARANIETTTNVVLTGRIGVKELTNWWVDGAPTFYISEGTEGSHYNAGPDHDPSTCPFCSRNWVAEDSMAQVTLVDSKGQKISVSADKLLDVKEGDVVVVRGTASVDESGYLTVNSDGIFVR